MIEGRQFADHYAREVIKTLCSEGHCNFSEKLIETRKSRITSHECAEKLVTTFSSHCFKAAKHPYTIKYLNAMVNIAEGLQAPNLDEKSSEVAIDLEKICKQVIPEYGYQQIE